MSKFEAVVLLSPEISTKVRSSCLDNLEKILTKTKIIIIELSSYQLDKIKFFSIFSNNVITCLGTDQGWKPPVRR